MGFGGLGVYGLGVKVQKGTQDEPQGLEKLQKNWLRMCPPLLGSTVPSTPPPLPRTAAAEAPTSEGLRGPQPNIGVGRVTNHVPSVVPLKLYRSSPQNPILSFQAPILSPEASFEPWTP